MENQNEQNFTFGSDESKDSYTSEIDNRKVEKLTQKVTLLSILMPCILGLLLVFLYFDMSNKVGQVDSSGSAKVQNISEELEKTISNLKLTSDELEKRLNLKTDKIEKSLIDIKKKMKKAEKNINFLTVAKINKKQVNTELKKVNVTTTQIQADLASVSNSNAQLVTIAEKLKERTNELDTIKESIKLLRADMAKTTNAFVNQKELENQLIKQKRLFQLEIKDTSDKIEKKIALLKFANQTDSKKTDIAKPKNN